MKIETIIGVTPNGGVMTKVFYLNNNEESVDKCEATKAMVCEIDKNGNVINETECIIVEKVLAKNKQNV